MTDEEKAKDIINRHFGYEIKEGSDIWFTRQYQDMFAELMEMARWKDEECFNDLIKSDMTVFNKMRDRIVDKACEWIRDQKEMIGVSFETDFIERFRKTMEDKQ